MKIGVFDSGIGGQSVANAIEVALPEHEVIFRNDSKNMPYGNKDKSIETVYGLALPILKDLCKLGCDVIVIACNTVSTNLIDRLRTDLNVPLIAMEPMVKPAAKMTNNNVIAVCATPDTLSSKRYKYLKDTYASGVKIVEPDCSKWSSMIESKAVDRDSIKKLTLDVCKQGADVIVLGCTHYHWIEDEIKQYSKGKASVLQPELPVIKELKRVISSLA